MLIKNNSKLVMIGDSITDCSRQRPEGEGLFGQLGTGYVSFVDALLRTINPEVKVRVVNMGISGNTVRDLKNRWQTDVLDQKPDWLSIMIGTNDVWRQFDKPLQTENYIYLDEYRQTLEELIVKTSPMLKGLVIFTPFVLDLNKTDEMRILMDKYSQVCKEVAEKFNAIFINTQEIFDKMMTYHHHSQLSRDQIHPNTVGHMILANAFLNAIGLKTNI